MEFVCISDLVPKEHLLRKIYATIDFEFIRDKVEKLYCLDNGRPAIDPVVLFKMLFIGYLYGIRSERQLVRDIEVNVAYRWFLDFDLSTKVPNASTISQNRRRRFNNSTVYQEIFDEIIFFAMNKGLVDGKYIYTDSTHLKANANKHKFTKAVVEKSTAEYIAALDAAVTEQREKDGKPPLPPQDKNNEKEIKQSTTDAESGFLTREGKPKGFYYLDHRSVDGKYNLITDTHITAGNLHDSMPYLSRLDRQIERFEFDVKAVGLDAGYNTVAICKGLHDREIFGAIAYRNNVKAKDKFQNAIFIMMNQWTATYVPIIAC